MRLAATAVALWVALALSPSARAADDARPTAWTATGGTAVEGASAAAADPEAFGIATDSVVTLTSGDFYFLSGTEAPFNLSTGSRSCAAVGPTGVCAWTAGVPLPTGAQIRGVEISACDSDNAGEVRFNMLRSPKAPGAATLIVPFLGTGLAATPGCTTFVYTLPQPVTVQNDVHAYYAVFNSTPGTNLEWTQYRVRYRLQVSPAPLSATFPNDVPTTHPFFRFIEALAAAGITGGCGTGSYCPDNAVTRGEMAVFLAAALGLHFPN
jgi:hypothetical protein